MNSTCYQFELDLKHKKERIESHLKMRLEYADWPPQLRAAMQYSVLAGGKRLRPFLLLSVCEILGTDIACALDAACAVEFIHTFSLIHDDLPALDNDDYRRGVPTNHRVFGDALAILSGDALLAEAFVCLTYQSQLPLTVQLELVRVLALATGAHGMTAGQVLDIANIGTCSESQLLRLHQLKTGALIEAAAHMGALIGGASPSLVNAVRVYAQQLGLAFQIVDDVLDVESTQEEMGKTAGRDKLKGKTTYVDLFGVQGAHRQAEQCIKQACESLSLLGDRAVPLLVLAQSVLDRRR